MTVRKLLSSSWKLGWRTNQAAAIAMQSASIAGSHHARAAIGRRRRVQPSNSMRAGEDQNENRAGKGDQAVPGVGAGELAGGAAEHGGDAHQRGREQRE